MESLKRRILCVEDDISTCEMLTFALGRLGYEVVAVHTLADAVHIVLSGNFDLYIIDGRLPDGSGLDLCKRIRKLYAQTPILLTSGDRYLYQDEHVRQAEVQAYFVKPVNLEEVVRAIQNLLSSPA
jgi:two-component system, NtrC family, response regulator HydG